MEVLAPAPAMDSPVLLLLTEGGSEVEAVSTAVADGSATKTAEAAVGAASPAAPSPEPEAAGFVGSPGVVAMGVAQENEGCNITGNSLWPATVIESLASINFKLGETDMWRKATILSDAAVAIICDPECNGQMLIDDRDETRHPRSRTLSTTGRTFSCTGMRTKGSS